MPRSRYSDEMDAYSTDSQWTVTYRKLPKKQPLSVRFLSWAAGAPRGATVVKKKTRDSPDDRSTHSGWSSGTYTTEQLYWVADNRSYYSGSSSSSGRSSRSGRKSRPQGKHFNGAFPPPHMPPPGPAFGTPMDGHFVPPPPGDMGSQYGGGFDQPPPPQPPMNGPMPGGPAPAFFDLSGGGHPVFQRGPPGGHHHMPPSVDDGWSESSDGEDE